MKKILFLIFFYFKLFAVELTISSYNCGGLPDHYDYLRAAVMQKLVQERYIKEPQEMARIEKIQKLALQILFTNDPAEKEQAEQEWQKEGHDQFLQHLLQPPENPSSPNHAWYALSEGMLSSYKVRPIDLKDPEVFEILNDHITHFSELQNERLQTARSIMAKRIFQHHLKQDIVCLQEASFINSSQFDEKFEIAISQSEHSPNAIAWKKERFELVEVIENMGKAFAVTLLDKESQKTLLVVSGHLSGCNPFQVNQNDSLKGDEELTALLATIDSYAYDICLIALDANVTSMHPRMKIFKNHGFKLDYQNFLETSCTNPYLILNTRIDWIVVKAKENVNITNIPILGVGLNSIETNISDHKPIAAKVVY